MTEKLRVAVVGLGVGFGHLAAYRELADQFEIVAVCDPVESKREIAQRILGVPHSTASFDQLLERDDLDIINICTPPNLHVAMADFEPGPELYEGQFLRFRETLERGEDPPLTVADARASIELASAIYYSARTGDAVSLPLGPEHPYYEGWID